MNNNYANREFIDIIDQMSYEYGEVSGYIDGQAIGYELGYRACVLKNKKLQRKRARRRLYFIKQRLTGVCFLLFTALMVWLLDGDATLAVFTIPIGLLLIFSKKKILLII